MAASDRRGARIDLRTTLRRSMRSSGMIELARKHRVDMPVSDAVQGVLGNTNKVLVDVQGGNNVLYLPLQSSADGSTAAAKPGATDFVDRLPPVTSSVWSSHLPKRPPLICSGTQLICLLQWIIHSLRVLVSPSAEVISLSSPRNQFFWAR